MAEPFPKDSGLSIFTIRGRLVVLDSDLAAAYGVGTGQFNRAVKRNAGRFPLDFGFILTRQEQTNLLCQIGRARLHGGRRNPIRVFTEHGAIMVAAILNSARAVAMSVAVVREFVRMRRDLTSVAELERRLGRAERALLSRDSALRELYVKLRPLLLHPPDRRHRIGFRPPDPPA